MPLSSRPMMARRWKHRYPDGVSRIRDMSGPRDWVRSKYVRTSSLLKLFLLNPIIAHMKKAPPDIAQHS